MQRSRRSHVNADTAWRVLQRDRFRCVASQIAEERGWYIDMCRDKWGEPAYQGTGEYRVRSLTLDHVNENYGRMGKAAPGDEQRLVTVCYHHHLNGWATGHRPELRSYIAKFYQPEPEGR